MHPPHIYESLFHLLILSVPTGSTITAYLINERRNFLEKTQQSEQKYRELVDNTLIGIYKSNLTGDILYVNKTMAKIFEFDSPEEMTRGSALLRYNNPKDKKILIEHLKRASRVDNFEIKVLTKTGKDKKILLCATLEGDTISGMIMDISERQQLEDTVKDRVKELEEFYNIAVGRELKMVELKEEIERLQVNDS